MTGIEAFLVFPVVTSPYNCSSSYALTVIAIFPLLNYNDFYNILQIGAAETMNRRKVILLVILIIVLISLSIKADIDQSTINGIVTSVIASFLFFIFTILVDNSNDEIKKVLSKMENEISTLKNQMATDPTTLRNRFGILKIEHRQEYSYDFWIALLYDAIKTDTSRFVISGKTLHRWLEPEIVKQFRETLVELISKKRKIIFVIYKDLKDPDDNKKREALREFLCDKIYPDLVKVCGENLKEINEVFSIYEVNSLPYLYTAVDNQVIVAQYFNNASNAENIMLVLDPDCSFARRYQDDFKRMIRDCINDEWIQNFLQNQKRGVKNEAG